AELGAARDVDDLGDQLFAAVIARMRFAGEDDLHRPVFVVDDGGEAVEAAEEQRAALVGREAAREADRQGFGAGAFGGAGDFTGGGAAALDLVFQPLPRERDRALAAALVRPPQFRVGNVVHALPDAVVRRPLFPLHAEVAVVKLPHLRG